jgi:hypothetical protein
VANKWDTPDTLYEDARLKPGSGAEKVSRPIRWAIIGQEDRPLARHDSHPSFATPSAAIKRLADPLPRRFFALLQRAFTYFVLGGARFIYASAARLAVINTVATLSASADVLALSSVEVDLAAVQPGQVITVKWRGKPVFIKRRTEAQIKAEAATNIAELRHQQTDASRVKDPEWCVWRRQRRGVRGVGRLAPILAMRKVQCARPGLQRCEGASHPGTGRAAASL